MKELLNSTNLEDIILGIRMIKQEDLKMFMGNFAGMKSYDIPRSMSLLTLVHTPINSFIICAPFGYILIHNPEDTREYKHVIDFR